MRVEDGPTASVVGVVGSEDAFIRSVKDRLSCDNGLTSVEDAIARSRDSRRADDVVRWYRSSRSVVLATRYVGLLHSWRVMEEAVDQRVALLLLDPPSALSRSSVCEVRLLPGP